MQAGQKLSTTAAVSLSDYDAIKETIQHYIAGGDCAYRARQLEWSPLHRLFHSSKG